jgi:small subunit ribosomal protein S6
MSPQPVESGVVVPYERQPRNGPVDGGPARTVTANEGNPTLASAAIRLAWLRRPPVAAAPRAVAIVTGRLSTADYELVLMLDPETPDERRDQIAAEARKRIESSGSLRAEKAWGMRKLAYEIRQRTEADYRFFRFETESPLLDQLDHSLKITDGVLRFRIFKVDPESPVIEPPPPVALASSGPGRGPGARRGPGRGREDREPEPAAPVAAAPAPAAPEPAPRAAEPPPSAPAESTPEPPAEPPSPPAPPAE